jgi:hypothetical protein
MFELVTAGRCIFILIFVGKARSYCMRLLRSAWWASSRTCRHCLTICLTGNWWLMLIYYERKCTADWLVVTGLFWQKKVRIPPADISYEEDRMNKRASAPLHDECGPGPTYRDFTYITPVHGDCLPWLAQQITPHIWHVSWFLSYFFRMNKRTSFTDITGHHLTIIYTVAWLLFI